MEFLGLDLSKMADSALPPLTPEGILKNFPLEFLTKPICPIFSPPMIDVYECSENSWLVDIRDMMMEVWRQPVTQWLGISVALTGVAVCSWRFSQYWDDEHAKCKPAKLGQEMRVHKETHLKLKPITTKFHEAFGRESNQDRREGRNTHLPMIKESFYNDIETEGFQNRLGKVIWRVRDIVRDLKHLDSQRRTLEAEIRIHQDTCSKLKELGNIERSKRQAAEDKMKMFELENLQLKQLNQIIAKKASLIDRLEFIIKEKNALERSDPMMVMNCVQKSDAIQNQSQVESQQEVETCPPPVSDKTEVNSTFEQELKETPPSVSSSSEKGDKSSSVIVLSEDDQERSQRTPSRWQSPSPVTKTSSYRFQSITPVSSSLTNIIDTRCHARKSVKGRSRSLHGSHQEAGLISLREAQHGEGKSQDVKDETALNMAYKKVSELDWKSDADQQETLGNVVEEGTFEPRSGGRYIAINSDLAEENNEYTFHASASPPKAHVRNEIWQESSGSSDGVFESQRKDSLGVNTKGDNLLQPDAVNNKMADVQIDREVVVCHENWPSASNGVDECGRDVSLSKEVEGPKNDEPLKLATGSNLKIKAEVSSEASESMQQIALSSFSSGSGERDDLEISGECATERSVDENSSKFPGKANLLRENKQLPSRKQNGQRKCQYQAVRFINKGARGNLGEEEENDLNGIKEDDDTWVVIMDHD